VGDVIHRNSLLSIEWDEVGELFARLESSGISHNLVLLAGHGTARSSIRGLDPSPLHPYESKELLRILEIAMDQGARGISLGLQHQPGMFASPEELKEIALTAKRAGKPLAAHGRGLPFLSAGASGRRFGEAPVLAGIRELLDLGRRTGVRLQLSHLVFAGSRTWHAMEQAIRLIDEAIKDGLDLGFDVCPHTFSVTRIGAALPPWFTARGPAAYGDGGSVRRLKREIRSLERRLGFGPSDVQIAEIGDPDAVEYNGRFLSEIARLRRLSPEDAFLEISRRSEGRARILCHKCSTEGIVEALMRHPAALFMTDSWVERAGTQNPGAFGAFPRFLQKAREKRLLSLEETIRKMTGAAAERFGIADRGFLREKLAADITVFDWESVADNTTPQATDAAPSGIHYVFVNGRKMIGSGRRENPLSAGIPLR
jgi:N-acyl-D-amino-acid deacylase